MVSAVIPAAGKGERLAGDVPKQFRLLGDRPVLAWSAAALSSAGPIAEMVVAAAVAELDRTMEILKTWLPGIPVKVVRGGENRQETVTRCLAAVRPEAELVIIHDAARPFVTGDLIREVLAAAEAHGAATAAIRPADTIKFFPRERGKGENLDRESLWAIQTPQAFRASLIRDAHAQANRRNFRGTDDTVLVEAIGRHVEMVTGNTLNLKITTAADWEIAKALVASGAVKPQGKARA